MKMKKKLKIAHLGHKRVPSREGGIEIVVEELATRMVQLGHDVVCYNRSGKRLEDKKHKNNTLKEYRGIDLKYVLTIDKKGLAAVTSSMAGAVAAAISRYDIVHFHAEGPAFMCWLPKLFGKRVVVTIHGLDWQRAKWGRFASAYIMGGEKAAVRFADEIIVLSNNVERYFWETYSRKTRFIPNGVRRPQLRVAELIREQYGLEKDSYLLFLGRIVPEKGLRYLIEAYQKVNTDKKLVIAGGSSDTEEFVSEIKSTAEKDVRIIFTGFVQGQILEELYSNAYLYILPSDLEGMPLSLLEAMSYGNCCLVSDIPECKEVVGECAEVFHKGDVRALQEKLQIFCDDEELVLKYKKYAADYICEKYNWEEVVRKTLDIYSGIGEE